MGRMHEIAEFLNAQDDFCLFGHINPDGDACGCNIALALALKKMGKRAFVYLPGGVPHIYQCFARDVEVVSDGNVPFVPRTAVTTDVSDAARMGSGTELYKSCPCSAMVDHHPSNPGFGDVQFIDGKAAACGELVVELIGELGVALDAQMATWLYVAIVTDSGRFGYSSVRPQTLAAAAECVRAGIDVDMITRNVFLTRTEGRTRLTGLVLSALQKSADGRICWSVLTDDMFSQAGAKREDNENIVNYLIEIEGVRVACLFEQRGKQTKLSLRARPPYNVAREIAVPLGGGGHAGAAGATLDLPIEAATALVLPMMQRIANEGNA